MMILHLLDYFFLLTEDLFLGNDLLLQFTELEKVLGRNPFIFGFTCLNPLLLRHPTETFCSLPLWRELNYFFLSTFVYIFFRFLTFGNLLINFIFDFISHAFPPFRG